MEQKRIYDILKGLVACDSISCTDKELKAEKYVYDFLQSIPYFKEHPERCGLHKIPNDPFARAVPYALILGKKRDTVILSGHIDVVDTQVYGDAEPLACQMGEELEKKLASMNLNEQQRADMESGEWIWGRGTADMKGGIAIAMFLLEKYAALAQKGELEGSVFFAAVADEESYSAGMRAISPVMLECRKKYDLKLKLLINPEPAGELGDAQILSLGSIGKSMPVIMVQGELAHVGHSFNGFNALSLLNGIFQRSNCTMDFVDTYKEEASMPAHWFNMRDMKELYDVSLPFRASGYLTVLSFDTTLDMIIEKLRAMSLDAFREEVAKLDACYQEFKKVSRFEKKEKVYYEPTVYTVQELTAELKESRGREFSDFYADIYKKAGQKITEGESYPAATVYMMDQLMQFADIKKPYVLIGVAPPYYPATHSDLIPGREGYGTGVYEFAKKLSEEKYGQKLTYENYFTGISDNSYTSLPDIDYEALAANYPMWGDLYSLDLKSIKELSVPAILYGPVGREYHQWTERVNRKSLLEVIPDMLENVIKFAWEN